MSVRWLHLTDLHIGRSDEAQRVAIRSLVAEVSKALGNEPLDAVFLTGDLAHSGSENEYNEFESIILRPLQRLEALRDAMVLAVPGNHDLDCNTTLPTPWNSLGEKRQQLFFQDTDDGRKTRASRANGFSEYARFIIRANITGLNPTTNCAIATTIRSRDGTSLKVIGVNTALFSDKDTSDELNAPAPTHAVRLHLEDVDKSTPTLVLAHHPVTWFLHSSQEPLKSLLYQRHSLYLHGHEHKVKVDTTKKGLRSLGFGAAYQAALDKASTSSYENSFAVCLMNSQLHVAIYSWHTEYGVWRPHSNLPVEFDQKSSLLKDGYVFDLPSDRNATSRQVVQPELQRPRSAPLANKAFLLESLEGPAWLWLLKLTGLVPAQSIDKSVDTSANAIDVVEMVISDGLATLHARCIGGQGHVLSAREVEVENTRMDTEGHRSVAILTFGEIADDARRLALQLERRKSFRTCAQSDLAKLLNAHIPQRISAHLDSLDTAEVTVSHLVGSQRWFILVQDRLRTSWFYLVNKNGDILPASDEVIAHVRRQRPDLALVSYGRQLGDENRGLNEPQPFDRPTYVAKCKLEFHTLKYDALAALGVRFPNASVEHMYVPANADVGDATGSSTAYRQAINDMLDSLNLDDAQRAQLETQLREGALNIGLKETGGASSLYQQYGSVLVLGDPGSGKTCFLKNEILSYCDTNSERTSWYKYHVPVFVPLVEAAAIDSNEIVEICSQLATRRGLPLSRSQLLELMANGHVAFFFDGLDEVAAMERRVQLLDEIGKLLTAQAPLGNRIALTSRPAAVQLLKLPKKIVTLHLRGLTDAEMRTLATKVLSAEYSPGDKIRLGVLRPEEAALVERLLVDCRTNPGIRRIARNPLLLTLLVMIYANSGPLAAKRHRVYSQAVQTLVSVRNRSAKQSVLSEADLRHRLGAVALETYQASQVDIPTVDWVCTVIAKSLDRDPTDQRTLTSIREFVQVVAEATGLLVIHKKGGASGESLVSFLHHSFLEYYAAVGFLETRSIDELPAVAAHARWREVIAIIAGLLADQSDSTDLIRTLIAPIDEGDKITLDRFLFSFDCALEADVPTEVAQELLATAVESAMAGPGLVDPSARQEIAVRIAKLLNASGSAIFRQLLFEKSRSHDPNIAASYIDLISYIGEKADLGREIVDNLIEACKLNMPEIRSVIFKAIERVNELRGTEAIAALREGLQGNVSVRYAAVHALDVVPALTKGCWAQAKACLQDSQAAISGTAARALMAAGVNINLADRSDRAFLETCLRQWARITDAEDVHHNQLKANRQQLDELLSSPAPEDRLLGLRLLPLLVREERYVYERIMDVVSKNRDRSEKVAALESLKISRGALGLLTIADVDLLGSSLESEFRDIRIAAAFALAAHPAPDAAVSRLLQDYTASCKDSELRPALRALVQVADDDTTVRSFVFSQTEKRISHALAHAFGNDREQKELEALLRACEELGGEGAPKFEETLTRLASSYRAPTRLRTRAIRALARVSQPSSKRIEYFIAILEGNDAVLGPAVGSCIVDFVKSCRLRVDNVRTIVPELGRLDAALVNRWRRIVGSQVVLRLDSQSLRGVRLALREVRELTIAYGEFATRRRVSS